MKKIISVSTVIILLFVAYMFVNRNESSEPKVERPVDSTVGSSSALRVVAFGDSLTAGLGLPLDEAYPTKLQEWLKGKGHDVEIINSGVSGETSAGGLRRVDFINSLDADIVLLGLGANDALRRLPVKDLEANLETIIKAIQKDDKSPVVILLGMDAPANLGLAYRNDFKKVYSRLAKEYNLELVPFMLEGIALRSEYNQSDGIHPNEAGVKIMVEKNIGPVVEPVVADLIKR